MREKVNTFIVTRSGRTINQKGIRKMAKVIFGDLTEYDFDALSGYELNDPIKLVEMMKQRDHPLLIIYDGRDGTMSAISANLVGELKMNLLTNELELEKNRNSYDIIYEFIHSIYD